MGRKFSKRKGDRKPRQERQQNESYSDIVKSNAAFESYYKAQGIIGSDSEWELFMQTLRSPLPVAFRITGSRRTAEDLRDFMKKTYFPGLNVNIDGEQLSPPTPIPWYPNELGWVFDCGKTMLKKSAEVQAFHQFLVAETEVGNITRQELVSMLPVLFMDVQSGHSVLDMCAAPGSKTSQLLEAIHMDEEKGVVTDGLVVANDSNQDRSYLLVHQAKRLKSPCLLVTNHEGQSFPLINLANNKAIDYLAFDRILCDVPCSGDGTMRKSRQIWQKWTVADGLGLHKLQKSILTRSCELLKVGGTLVYSTCSFNPIENEAVVASFLNSCDGAFRLVDVSHKLPSLKRSQGLSTWKVQMKNGEFIEAYDPERPGIHPSMFPPHNALELGLDKCLRVYPHFQNCGGFFIAVFEKLSSNSKVDKNCAAQQYECSVAIETSGSDAVDEQNAPKRPKIDVEEIQTAERRDGWRGTKEQPFIYLDKDHPAVKSVCETYSLNPSFPRDLFVSRTDEKDGNGVKGLYFTSKKVKQVLTAANSYRLRLVNAGIKVFKQQGANPLFPFRVCSQGVSTVCAFIGTERTASITLKAVCTLISNLYPKFIDFEDDVAMILSALPLGSCLLRLDPSIESGYQGSIQHELELPCFRAGVSVSLLLSTKERKSVYQQLTGMPLQNIHGQLEKDSVVEHANDEVERVKDEEVEPIVEMKEE